MQPTLTRAILLLGLWMTNVPLLPAATGGSSPWSQDNLAAWCIVPFDAEQRGPLERAQMLQRLGLTKLAYDYRDEHVPQFDAEIEAMKQHGIEIAAWWFPVTLDPLARQILEVLQRHDVHPQLWVTGWDGREVDAMSPEQRLAHETGRIREIATAAAAAGCQVGLYNHGGWFGEPDHQVAIIQRLQREGVSNVGIVYNFHHGHAHLSDFAERWQRMRPHVIAVNLNGMVRGGDERGQKIMYVGEGEEELRLMRVIEQSGWNGLVGILNHQADVDAEVALRRNLAGVQRLAAVLAEERGEREPYRAEWESLDQRPMPGWFADAKFGVFIHWGVYSVPAWAVKGEYAEWYWNRIRHEDPRYAPWRDFHETQYPGMAYEDFAPQFRAELFDARAWADLLARSGARYVVPTSKHHDGFALWPSAEASRTWGRPWNSVEIGPRRDLMQELADAVRERGLTFGLYFSLYEWFNPLWLSDRERYVAEHMIPQFKDVVTRYEPALIFSDGEWDLPSSAWRSEEMLAWLFNQSPVREHVVVNDRWGRETRHRHGGYWTTEYAAGLQDDRHPWEESRGMGHSYGFNRAERIEDYKTSRELILVLVDLVSRGGNLLLDIGPAADGTIPPIMEERLLEIGAWLQVNGEAIYGTRFAGRSCQWTEGERPTQEFGEYRVTYALLDQVGQEPKDGRAVKQVFFTKKDDALYAITAGWPGSTLTLRGVRASPEVRASLLGWAEALPVEVDGDQVVVRLPALGPEEAPGRHAFTIKLEGAEVLPEPREVR